MKLTDREKWIVLLLPIGVVLIVYAWWFAMRLWPELSKVRREHAAAVAGQVSSEAVARQRAEVIDLRDERHKLQAKKKDLDAQAAELCGRWTGSGRQLEANRELIALFARHRLHLVDEAPLKKGADSALPKSLAEALKRLGWKPQSGGDVRAFKLTGPFPQVLQAVRELAARRQWLAIPIGLSMAQVDQSVPERQWTLLVWM